MFYFQVRLLYKCMNFRMAGRPNIDFSSGFSEHSDKNKIFSKFPIKIIEIKKSRMIFELNNYFKPTLSERIR